MSAEKIAAFRALHVPGKPFVMPNPWDLGSARMLVALGAKAIATTSSGFAFTLGRPDMGQVSREEAVKHAQLLAEDSAVPLNADLENGFGPTPDDAAETVRQAAAAGLAGCSIEDTDLPGAGAYPYALAVERIEAAVAAASASGIVLTARADGWLNRAYDADEVVRRCRAFADIGADVLYAPLVKIETLGAICRIGPPVNALAARKMALVPVAEYAAVGVARISIGGALARLAHKAILDVGRAMFAGDLALLADGPTAADIDPLLARDRTPG